MTRLADALREPIPLAPNRIPRFYRGGLMLDRFRGAAGPADGDRPEDWVGSATRAWTSPGTDAPPLGLSSVLVEGRPTTLEELLREEPEALVGGALLERAGPTLGVLVKLLDAGERLPVHCHPSREEAAALLGSRFGKTEAWLILATRDGGPASVWVGFSEDVAPDRLRAWIDRQDGPSLLASLSEHRVVPGDVLLIGGGVPHAIGAGVFLLELQEPTDYSVVAELQGFPIDPEAASLGLGWDRAIGLFRTDAAPDPRQAPTAAGPGVERLLGAEADAYFRALRQRINGTGAPPFDAAFAVGVVLDGRGTIRGAASDLDLRTGSTFALPAASVPHARLEGMLEIVWCLGPEPAALDRAPLPVP